MYHIMNYCQRLFLLTIALSFCRTELCVLKKKKLPITNDTEIPYPGTLSLENRLKFVGFEKTIQKKVLKGKNIKNKKLPHALPIYYLALENLLAIFKKNGPEPIQTYSYTYDQMFTYIACKKELNPLTLLKFIQELKAPDEIIKVTNAVKNDATCGGWYTKEATDSLQSQWLTKPNNRPTPHPKQ
ncbi:TPA: hypothetical protein DDZ86_00615 [Candidatus Dependentiae bacterium]|nr:MAG: hypothetical protein UW09_C0002G0005 [candidate division TM6 bacterium GW2011_GWF2_43_87]HBL98126.1 hypothetical protein [Candidatus Dependentiae bacterium]